MFYVFYFMIYKSLTRLYLDNGNVIYDAFFSSSFHEEHDSIQYSAAWALRSAIRGTFNKKVYEKNKTIGGGTWNHVASNNQGPSCLYYLMSI